MRGHEFLADLLLDNCLRLNSSARASETTVASNRIAFEFFNSLAERNAEIYAAENDRLIAAALALRQDYVDAVLSGDHVDLTAISATLRYDIGGRHHIGVVAWHDPMETPDAAMLSRATAEWLTAAGAEQTLIVGQGRTTLWA